MITYSLDELHYILDNFEISVREISQRIDENPAGALLAMNNANIQSSITLNFDVLGAALRLGHGNQQRAARW